MLKLAKRITASKRTSWPPRELRILLLEDSEADAGLIIRSIRKAVEAPRIVRVETEVEFRDALISFSPDVVLSDFNLPSFNGLQALKIVMAEFPLLPFIFVTGTLGEERAVETLKSGATDFVLKANLSRLGHCLLRGIREKREHKKRLQAQQLLNESQQRLELALKGAELGTIDWHLETGKIILDDRWQKISGNRTENVSNLKVLMSYIHPKDLPELRAKLKSHMRGETSGFVSEHRIRTAFGIRWVLDKGKVVERDIHGKPLRYAGTRLDITERKLIEEKFVKTSQELINSNEELEQFAYVASHNLRAPVANLLGLLKLQGRELRASGGSSPVFRRIEASVLRLDQVLDGMTLCLKTYKATEVRDWVSLTNLVDNTLEMLRQEIDASGASVHLSFDKAKMVNCQQNKLTSVVFNLISNAIKFHRPGVNPVVRLQSSLQSGKFCLKITDNGIGVDLSKHKERLFQMFQRINLDQPGQGLGLYIVKKQVESMDGNLDVASEVGHGTTFTVTLPHATRLKSITMVRYPSVMIVDDDPINNFYCREMIMLCDFSKEITCFEGVDAGMAHLKNCLSYSRSLPDILLLDINMPVKTGWDFLEEYQQLQSEFQVSVLIYILSSSVYQKDIDRAEKIQEIEAFLTKPLTEEHLEMITKHWLSLV